jgi:hypothetical protein
MTWHNDGKKIPVPGLIVWGEYPTTWLVLDKREELRGKVFGLLSGSTIYTLEEEDNRIYDNWIEFLKELWSSIEWEAHERATNPEESSSVCVSGGGSSRLPRFPGIPWTRSP